MSAGERKRWMYIMRGSPTRFQFGRTGCDMCMTLVGFGSCRKGAGKGKSGNGKSGTKVRRDGV